MKTVHKNLSFLLVFALASLFLNASFSAPTAKKTYVLNWAQLHKLSRTKQRAYIKKVQNFLVKSDFSRDPSLRASIWDILFPSAFSYAEGQACIFAGKISGLTNMNGRWTCANPGPGSCTGDKEVECSPIAFGAGICVTPPFKNATEDCQKKSSSEKKTPDKSTQAEWDAYVKSIDGYCNGSDMLEFNRQNCDTLREQTGLAKSESTSQPDESSATPAANAVSLTKPAVLKPLPPSVPISPVEKGAFPPGIKSKSAEKTECSIVSDGTTRSVTLGTGAFRFAQNSNIIHKPFNGLGNISAMSNEDCKTAVKNALSVHSLAIAEQDKIFNKLFELLVTSQLNWLAFDNKIEGNFKTQQKYAKDEFNKLKVALTNKGIDFETIIKIFTLQYGEVYFLMVREFIPEDKFTLKNMKSENDVKMRRLEDALTKSIAEIEAAIDAAKGASDEDKQKIKKIIQAYRDKAISKPGQDEILENLKAYNLDSQIKKMFSDQATLIKESTQSSKQIYKEFVDMTTAKGSGFVVSRVSDQGDLPTLVIQSCLNKNKTDSQKVDATAQ